MNLSMKWLNDYVNLGNQIDIKAFVHGMTMSGSKVETYKSESDEIKNVVVGQISEITKHPDADSLFICKVKVNISDENDLQIVTGASNLKKGDLVPVALDGSELPGGVKIKTGKLRGALSEGMLCSSNELKLSKNDFPYADENGIFILNGENVKTDAIGSDMCKIIGLDDTQVEFEITSNRPDCLSVTGLAREAGATFNLPVTIKPPAVKGSGDDINNYLSVEVKNTELCPRYIARIVKNVKIEPSPRWMRERLRASGVRPINNFVDITNYVMLEYGNPMHAFDLKYVKGNKIIVRNAEKSESIMTLDGTTRCLSPEMLVICDEESPVAVAGIMGGEHSGIMNDTNFVVFEGACFNGSSIRTTSKKLGLRTDSSARFEKGLDPQICMNAVTRACELVEMLGAGEVVDGIIDIYPHKKDLTKISIDWDWINSFLGTDIPKNKMVDILRSLDFRVEGDEITVPSFRVDVKEKADIAEEIARIYGYGNILPSIITGVAEAALTNEQKFHQKIHNIMTGMGFYEIITFSFISPGEYEKINLPKDSMERNCIKLINPLGEDTSVMRTTLIPSMLNVLANNYSNRNMNVRLYEIGKTYIKTENELPDEDDTLTIGIYEDNANFYLLKGALELLLERLGIENAETIPVNNNETFHTGKCAEIIKDSKTLAIFGEIHPSAAEAYGLCTVYIAEINLKNIFTIEVPEKQYKSLPKYPSTTRDLSLICHEELPVAEIEKIIRTSVGNELENLSLFDVYKGSQIGEGKKSVSYSILMRANDRTMTVEETDKLMTKTLANLEKINVTLRV